MSELERDLTLLGNDLAYPVTPDLARPVAAAVRGRPAGGPRRRPRRAPILMGVRRPLALAAGLLLLAGGTAFAAVPDFRDAVLRLLQLRGGTVERTSTLPDLPERRTLDLGRPIELADARNRVGFRVVSPRRLGRPDATYLSEEVAGGMVTLAYRPSRLLPRVPGSGLGMLISQFDGRLDPDFLRKLAGPDTDVDSVRVEGRPGLWLEGAAHVVMFRDARGRPRPSTARLAANTLLVERGRLLVRIESRLSRRQALALAASLR
jgi:hypothetical protein